MNRKEEIEVSNKLIKELKQRGFKINRYYAHGTKSIYLKLDYGACCGIRISDHKGKKRYRYRFNIIKNYKVPRKVLDRWYVRLYYDYNKIKEVISDIQNEKKAKINEYGLYNYQKIMKKNSKTKLYESFKNVA